MALNKRQRNVLWLLGAATFFEGYDRFIVALALSDIGRDFAASEGTLGYALAAIRLGGIASIGFGMLGDRFGRRRLLLATIMAYTIATAATGLSRGVIDFIGFQMLANAFLLSELSLAQVVIAEAFPAERRAAGQAALGVFAAAGAGAAAFVYPLVEQTRFGWRAMYLIGAGPLVLVAALRRYLPETERFESARARGDRGPLRELFTPPLARPFATLVLLALAVTAATATAFSFATLHARRNFGWSPTEASAMVIIGGGVGLLGWFVFGWLADRVGRRPVGLVAFTGAGASVALFYQTSFLYAAMALIVFTEAGCALTINTLGTELFPTRLRSTAKAWITSATLVGATAGMSIVGALGDGVGVQFVIPMIAAAPIAAGPAVLGLPETRGRELEELSAPPHR